MSNSSEKPAELSPPAKPAEPSQPDPGDAAADDPLIAQLNALLDRFAAACKTEQPGQAEQPAESEIPADVPRFVTVYPWAS